MGSRKDQVSAQEGPHLEGSRAISLFSTPAKVPNSMEGAHISNMSTFETDEHLRPPSGSCAARHREMRLIFEPSKVKLYISPVGSRMNPITGLVSFSVSSEPPSPIVAIAIDPSTPTLQP